MDKHELEAIRAQVEVGYDPDWQGDGGCETCGNHVLALLAHIERLEFMYTSNQPGTQGAMLDAYHKIAEGLPGYNPVDSSKTGVDVIREHIERLQAIEAAAALVNGLVIFSESNGVEEAQIPKGRSAGKYLRALREAVGDG